MTEHNERDINTAAITLQGIHGGVLFLNGNELSIEGVGRVLIIPGLASQDDAHLPLETLATNTREKQGLTLVAYPQEFTGWGTNTYDGVEVYNVYTNAQQINPLVMFFDGLWSYRNYPDLLFANFYDRPSANLRLWDQELARGRRLTALAGNDSHANVGIGLNDSAGNSVLSLHLDPYERSFSTSAGSCFGSTGHHSKFSCAFDCLSGGHCFIGFDLFQIRLGFALWAAVALRFASRATNFGFRVKPFKRCGASSGRIVLRRNGAIEAEEYGSAVDFVVKEPGAYRCEDYLPQLPHPVREQPWIISNPIYVR